MVQTKDCKLLVNHTREHSMPAFSQMANSYVHGSHKKVDSNISLHLNELNREMNYSTNPIISKVFNFKQSENYMTLMSLVQMVRHHFLSQRQSQTALMVQKVAVVPIFTRAFTSLLPIITPLTFNFIYHNEVMIQLASLLSYFSPQFGPHSVIKLGWTYSSD